MREPGYVEGKNIRIEWRRVLDIMAVVASRTRSALERISFL